MRKAACLENDSRMKVSQRQPRVVAGNGRIDVDRLLKLNHEPTADDEQNGRESQPQRSVRDMNCHPAADHNTGDGAGEQRSENGRVDGADDPMANAGDQRQWHGVCDVGANDARRGKPWIEDDQRRHADGPGTN